MLCFLAIGQIHNLDFRDFESKLRLVIAFYHNIFIKMNLTYCNCRCWSLPLEVIFRDQSSEPTSILFIIRIPFSTNAKNLEMWFSLNFLEVCEKFRGHSLLQRGSHSTHHALGLQHSQSQSKTI